MRAKSAAANRRPAGQSDGSVVCQRSLQPTGRFPDPSGSPSLVVKAPSASFASLCVLLWLPDTASNPLYRRRQHHPHRHPPSAHSQAGSDCVAATAGTQSNARRAHERTAEAAVRSKPLNAEAIEIGAAIFGGSVRVCRAGVLTAHSPQARSFRLNGRFCSTPALCGLPATGARFRRSL